MSQFAAYKENRRAIVDVVNVDSVSGMKVALMTDLQTKGQFTIPMSAPGRITPQEGDIWQLSRETGYWAFDKLIAKSQESVVSTMGQAMQVMTDLGLMEFVPEYRGYGDPSGAPVELPVGAHVGQIRWFFSDVVPAGWLKLDGSLYSRLRYRRLFNLWGTTYGVGDGSTTFGSPTMTPFVNDTRSAIWRQWRQAWGLQDSTGFFSAATSGTGVSIPADRSITLCVSNRLWSAEWNTSDHFGDTLGDTVAVDVTLESATVVAGTNIQVAAANQYIAPGLVRRLFTTSLTTQRVRCLGNRISGTGSFTIRGYFQLFDIGPNGSPLTQAIWPYVYAGDMR